MEENYSERYERLKKTGATPAIFFIPKQTEKEKFKYITGKQVPGIDENRYMISNYGNLYDNKMNKFIGHKNLNNDYYRASIHTINGTINKPVHRLEMLTFNYVDNYSELQVNHIDGNPSNNTISNLEWVTPKENSDHAMLVGLHKMNGVENPNSKLTREQVEEICKLIQSGKYYDTEIAEMYNVSYTNISDIHNKNIWCEVSRNYDLSYKKPLGLTEDQVEEICKLLETGNYFTTELARMFDTTHTNIINIREGKTWKNISDKYDIKGKKKARKLSKEQVEEICKLIETGNYYDREIARMYNTTGTEIGGIRKGIIHREISQKYDMTVRKPRSKKKIAVIQRKNVK